MGEYDGRQSKRLCRAVAYNGLGSKQLKRFVDNRSSCKLIQRAPFDVLIKGKLGGLREGTDKWGFIHLVNRHGNDFKKHGIEDNNKLLVLIEKALNETHVNDIRPSSDERGGWTLDYPLRVYLEKGEEWDIRVIINAERSVTTAMPIPSESMVDRWEGGITFYQPLIGVEKTEEKA